MDLKKKVEEEKKKKGRRGRRRRREKKKKKGRGGRREVIGYLVHLTRREIMKRGYIVLLESERRMIWVHRNLSKIQTNKK